MTSHFQSMNNSSSRKRVGASAIGVRANISVQTKAKPIIAANNIKQTFNAANAVDEQVQEVHNKIQEVHDIGTKNINSVIDHVQRLHKDTHNKLQAVQGQHQELSKLVDDKHNSILEVHQNTTVQLNSALLNTNKEQKALKDSIDKVQREHLSTKHAVHNDVTKAINTVASALDTVKNSHDTHVGAVRQTLDTHAQQMYSLYVTNQTDITNLKNEIAQTKKSIGDLHSLIEANKNVASNILSIGGTNGNVQQEYAHFGAPFNLPEQPVPVKEAGVWKDAPLALSVNGGVGLFNIGHSDKKGRQVMIDPSTHRLYVYSGK